MKAWPTTGKIYEVVCASCSQPKSPYLTNPPLPTWVCIWCAQQEWRKSHKSKVQHTPPRKMKAKPQRAKDVMAKVQIRVRKTTTPPVG